MILAGSYFLVYVSFVVASQIVVLPKLWDNWNYINFIDYRRDGCITPDFMIYILDPWQSLIQHRHCFICNEILLFIMSILKVDHTMRMRAQPYSRVIPSLLKLSTDIFVAIFRSALFRSFNVSSANCNTGAIAWSKCLYQASDTICRHFLQCLATGGDLVSIHSSSEEQFLLALLKTKFGKESSGLWIGLNNKYDTDILMILDCECELPKFLGFHGGKKIFKLEYSWTLEQSIYSCCLYLVTPQNLESSTNSIGIDLGR